jgi:hypothetical protein
MIDGVECELISRDKSIMYGDELIRVKIPTSKPRTIVQVAAESWAMNEKQFRDVHPLQTAIYEAIEQRLQAIEKRWRRSDENQLGKPRCAVLLWREDYEQLKASLKHREELYWKLTAEFDAMRKELEELRKWKEEMCA